jgi:hypothetical protein
MSRSARPDSPDGNATGTTKTVLISISNSKVMLLAISHRGGCSDLSNSVDAGGAGAVSSAIG